MSHSPSRSVVPFSAVVLCSVAAGQVTQRVSLATGGGQANDECRFPSISGDGRYVVFRGDATNLVPGDTNADPDIFLRDRQTGATSRVSVGPGGVEGNSGSNIGSISADGRYVAFDSGATNFVTGASGNLEVYVRDLVNGTTELASVAQDGSTPVVACWMPSISSDGRYVVFRSRATNLIPGDTNNSGDVFLRDRANGTTERVSVGSGGAQGNGESFVDFYRAVSGDGRFVVFESDATNLVGGDTNGFEDVFLRDRSTGTTERVSVATGGIEANGYSLAAGVSDDGRYVLFDSVASNLVAASTNPGSDVFVRDRLLGTTKCISIALGGNPSQSMSVASAISANGRYAAFEGYGDDLVAGDANGRVDVFVRDLQGDTTEIVSVSSAGAQTNQVSWAASIAADGRCVAYSSLATNLVQDDTNGVEDMFVRDRFATGFTSLCDPGIGGVIPCPCSNPPAGSGHGCDNFGAGPADSGTLTASGVAYLSMDTIHLTATGEDNSSLTVFWTGKDPLNPTGVAHGAGVRCVTQALKRMYTHTASGGTVSAPVGADLSVSARTAQLYGTAITAGETRHYFAIYRDPQAATPCGNTSSTVNLTNAGSITWNL